jgi:glutaredoxin
MRWWVLLFLVFGQFTFEVVNRCRAGGEPEKKRVVIYSPAWCPACKKMRNNFAAVGFEHGDTELTIEWRDAEYKLADAYPFAVCEERGVFATRRDDGKHWTLNALRKLAGLSVR